MQPLDLETQSTTPTTAEPQVPLHSFTTPTPVAGVPAAQEVSPKGPMKTSNTLFVVVALVAVVAGVGTGLGIGKLKAAQSPSGEASTFEGKSIQAVAGSSIKNGDIFGSANESAFKDSAEGYLAPGGIDGEGSEHLLRPGGKTQTVSLTSSATDLSKFEGMQVKVWGDTFQGQKAGWLMDVGRVQVINTKGEAPVEK